MALIPQSWGIYFVYLLIVGVPERDFSGYIMAGTFWGCYSLIVFLYQAQVALDSDDTDQKSLS